LLAGLYEPADGHLLFNGNIIDTNNRDWFRQHVSSVFADFHLFENLHCGPAAEARAREYLKRLCIDHKVEIDNGRLTTLKLSAGQRRRLALVAAFLHDRPICIFDEWAADQDPEFKRFFYEEFLIELRRQQKAVIVITHDDRYFGIADTVIKLEEGRIVEHADDRPPEVTNHRTMESMLQEVVARLTKLEGGDDIDALLVRAREQQDELHKWRDRPPSPDRKYQVVAEVMAVIGSASRFS
jgi:ABC-type siderophore export system fused ATPase/permease subunit